MQTLHNTLFDLPPVTNNEATACVVKKRKHSPTYILQGSLYQNELYEIVQLVCEYYGVDVEKVCEKNLHPKDDIALARRLICYLWGATKRGHSVQYVDIMILLHLQNHSSIIKGAGKALKNLREDPQLKFAAKTIEIYTVMHARIDPSYPLLVNAIWYDSKVYGKETIYPDVTCKDKMELAKLINNKVPIDVKAIIINNKISITL